MTQREMLEVALRRHGCTMVKAVGKWHQWTEGDLANERMNADGNARFLFLGVSGGFRHGRSRTNSFDWPRTKARLLAEWAAFGDTPLIRDDMRL